MWIVLDPSLDRIDPSLYHEIIIPYLTENLREKPLVNPYMTAAQTVFDIIEHFSTAQNRNFHYITLYPISPQITLNLRIRSLIANRISPYKFIKKAPKITFSNLSYRKSRGHLRSFTVHKISFAVIYGSLQCYKVIYGSAGGARGRIRFDSVLWRTDRKCRP